VLFLLGAACLIAALFAPPNRPSRCTSLMLRVVRDGRDLPLTEAIPLRSRDRVRLEGFVDESSHVASFAVSDMQVPQWLGPVRTNTNREGSRVVFPEFSGSIPLSYNGGTLLVLLVSRRDAPIRRQDTVKVVPPDSRSLSLSTPAAVVFGREQCEIHVAAGTSITDRQRNELRQQIRSLRTQLSRRFDRFAGILVVGTQYR